MKTMLNLRSLVLGSALALTSAAVMFGAAPFDNYQKHLKIAGTFTIAVAEQMPEAEYSFKLTPAQMSFGEQIAHIANANMYFFSFLAGDKPSDSKPASLKKADVIAFVKQSNEYCQKVLAHVTPDQMAKMYKTDDGEMTGAELVMLAFDHTTHHRAQAEMYLRAKGITPTGYKF